MAAKFIVTNMSAKPEGVVHFYHDRGTAEQWIKEGTYALHWTRLSGKRFVCNQVRLGLFVLAYNLGNFLRRLVLPRKIKHGSLRSLLAKLIKIGAKVVRHSGSNGRSNGPAADWTRPHGAPRPTTIPRRICQPHELLRAQLTHPEPPDVGGDVPSCPARAAAHPPLPPGRTGPLRDRRCCFNPARACGAVQSGVFRGSELRFGLAIIPVIGSPTRTNRVILTLPAGKMGGWSTPRHRWFLGRDFCVRRQLGQVDVDRAALRCSRLGGDGRARKLPFPR